MLWAQFLLPVAYFMDSRIKKGFITAYTSTTMAALCNILCSENSLRVTRIITLLDRVTIEFVVQY